MMNVEVRNDAKEKDKFTSVLTVEKVLTTKGFERLTRKEAEEYIIGVERYCLMMYQLFLLEQKKTGNNIKRLAA